MKTPDISGQQFGRWFALKEGAPARHKRWLMRCECGVEKEVFLDSLLRGASLSCGCLAKELTKSRSTKHGAFAAYGETREMSSYRAAKKRCTDPKHHKYPSYGGRGIRMCEAWLNDFGCFLRDMGPRPPGTTLERKDANGHYSPENCEWATSRQQARSRRNNLWVEHKGVRMILSDYATAVGVSYKALHSRVSRGQNFAEAAQALLLKAR